MARQVIVTDFKVNPDGITANVAVVMWLSAPTTRQLPLPQFVSQVPPSSLVPWGVTPQELNALRLGQLVELTYSSTSQPNLGAVLSEIASFYAAQQSALTSTGYTANYIGASYDGNGWVTPPNPVTAIP